MLNVSSALAAERRPHVPQQYAAASPLSNNLSSDIPFQRLNSAPTKEQHTNKMSSTSEQKSPQKSASPRYPRRRRAALPLPKPLPFDSLNTPANHNDTGAGRRRRHDLRISTQVPLGFTLPDVESGEEQASSDDMSTIYITSSEEEREDLD